MVVAEMLMMNLRLVCLALVTAAVLGCDDGPTSPTTISSGGSNAPLNLAGTWNGPANDSDGQMTMTWVLTQSDRNVSGTFTASTPVGAPIYTGGSIAGVASGTTLTFTITVPRGSIVDAPDCSVTFTGTTDDLRADSMSGTYTGSDTCGGTVVGGRLSLLKQ
jgi:hypothetical protein